MATINMTSEDFNDFLRCLNNLKEICTDVDIRQGTIRQRSNDLTCAFEMDLTSLIEDIQIPITDLKKKLDLFKTFAGQPVTIEVDDQDDEKKFILSDDISSVKFNFPSLDFMDNKYMQRQELENIFCIEEDDLIIHDEISQLVTDRIRIISENFNTAAVQVRFFGETASIHATTQSKDQFATFKSGITTNMIIEGAISNLSTIPFSIEHDTDVEFMMYKEPGKDTVALNKISTDLGSVKINIYSRSAIIDQDDQE